MKIGLVLEGGANRGIFTCGVMDYLMEQGVTFHYAVGTSAGAGNVLNFLAGQKGRGRDITVAQDKRYRYFGLDILLKTGHLFDMQNIYWTVPTKINLFDFDAYFANPQSRTYTFAFWFI